MTGSKRNVHVSRSQLSLQPAFAITGHSAQGKTLPQVLVDLTEGGFAAYVSTSRARTRNGLFITEMITLENLNRPVSSDLQEECRRLERLEYNTKVRYGFETGPIPAPLNPEIKADAPIGPDTALNSSRPLPQPSRIRPPPALNCTKENYTGDGTETALASCVWSANSCAYDTFFMLMFSLYSDSSPSWRQEFVNAGPWFVFLSSMFDYLTIPTNTNDPTCFSKCRDDLRSMLSEYDGNFFPRPGQAPTSIIRVFEAFQTNSCRSQTLSQTLLCDGGCFEKRNALHLPGTCEQSGWANAVRSVNFEHGLSNAMIQLFVDLQIAAKTRRGLTS